MRVAEMNQGARQGHLQLVSEAHVLLRTWLHRLTWLQVRQLFIFILVHMFLASYCATAHLAPSSHVAAGQGIVHFTYL
jgi:hypothetical protein